MSDAARGDAPPPLTPEWWATTQPLVDRALELSGDARASFIAEVAAGDAARGRELARLVELCERGDSPLEAAAAYRDAIRRETADDAFFADLQRALGDAYRLQRELGGGGMSRVFEAVEPALGRHVVLKLLTPELAAGVSADRFAREIRLAASLQQANIVPLLAAGSASGLPYYTMPFVEGRSLRDRVAREGALPIGDAIGILRDVARALAYAHAHGVVHRDVKPDNVLLSGGTAVVSDFGIAKAIGEARAALGSGAVSLTSVGVGIGTPAYMAPEQAAGDPGTDHRADIYAFGCLAYEVLTGVPPFRGRSVHQLVAAHFSDPPEAVHARRPDVPPTIDALVARCLEKDPARRPQSAAELLEVLDSPDAVSTPRPGVSAPPARRPARRTVTTAIAGASVVVAVATTTMLARRSATAEPLTFAVIPCRNVGGDTALEYRSDGLSDEILDAMGRVAGVRVTGRTAAYRFKGRADLDARAAQRTLGARLLLTCTLRQSGPEVALSTQLSDSVTGGELMATTLTGDRGDFGGLTDQVVSSILSTLRLRFGIARGDTTHRPSSVGTANGQALDDYLLGQALLKKRGTGVARSIPMFEHAISLDPSFARAYAALANALQLIPYFDGTLPSEVHDRTINAAQRALQLDSTLADAHMALGSAYAYRGEWERANAEFQRGVSLEPGNATAHFTFGRNLLVQGRVREAREQFEAAHAVERVSALVSTWMSYVHFVDGQPDSAVAESQRAVQLDSTLLPVINLASIIDIDLGHKDVAARLNAQPLPVTEMTNVPYVAARLGDTARAERALRAMDANEPRPWFADISRASYALARGDTATALTLIERTQATVGPIWAVFIPLQDPLYDPIRGSARFAAILRAARMNVELLTRPHGGRIG